MIFETDILYKRFLVHDRSFFGENWSFVLKDQFCVQTINGRDRVNDRYMFSTSSSTSTQYRCGLGTWLGTGYRSTEKYWVLTSTGYWRSWYWYWTGLVLVLVLILDLYWIFTGLVFEVLRTEMLFFSYWQHFSIGSLMMWPHRTSLSVDLFITLLMLKCNVQASD